MTECQRIEMTARQADMIVEAMNTAVQAKQRYDAMINLLLAGADVPTGSQYEIRIGERVIVVTPAQGNAQP